MKTPLATIFLVLLGAFSALASSYTTITNQHVDLDVVLVGGSLSGSIGADNQGTVARHQGLLYDGPTGTTGAESPGGAFGFLGVGAGETVYLWPQGLSGDPERIYLGFAAESIPSGSLASYYESDSRVDASQRWIKISLADVRYHAAPGETGPAHFSLWQFDSFGLTQWMSTYEGGITSEDATWIIEGGHVHYNWGFTKRGYYEIDFVFSAYEAGTNNLLQSGPLTYHFGVEFLPEAIPEPGSTALLVLAGALLAARRRRRVMA